MNRRFRNSCIVLGVLVVGVTVFAAFSVANAQTQKIIFAMDWMLSGTHSAHFTTLAKGFYKEAGLDVEIVRGYGSGDTAKKIGAKHATFGICDFGTLVTLIIREELPAKALAAVYGKSTLGLLYLAESGIRQPKDIEGKVLGRSAAGSSVNMLPAFFKANDIDRSKIKEVIMGGTSMLPMLLARKIDICSEQPVHLSRFQRAADEGGHKYTVKGMLFADFGLESYGNVIATNRDLISENPELCRKFVQTTLKGMAYAFGHHEEAVRLFVEANQAVTYERAIGEFLAIRATWTEAEKANLGFMTPEKTKTSVDSICTALGLQKPKTLDLVYTNKFVK